VASLVWRRRAEAVQFGVRIPPKARQGTVIGTLEVTLDSAPVGRVKFKLEVGRRAEVSSEPQGDQARRYTAAFISYASENRAEVLERVQMLSTVGIRYFQDVLSLEPGDRWERKLELGIDECDLFLLFWSSEAKRSKWVRREVRHALARQGGDELAPPEIRPVILEGPPIVAPWKELRHLHFNDPLVYFMRPP
jgi:TIR domain